MSGLGIMNSGMSATTAASLLWQQSGKSAAMSAAQMDQVAQDFESMFVSQMLEPMFGDSLGESAFGDSQSSDVYKGLMMDAYGKEITKAGGVGIASYVKSELLKLQEVKS